MNRSQVFDGDDKLTDDEAKVSKNAASEFTTLLKAKQADRTNQSQDFEERLTDYVPASPVKKKKT